MTTLPGLALAGETTDFDGFLAGRPGRRLPFIGDLGTGERGVEYTGGESAENTLPILFFQEEKQFANVVDWLCVDSG